MTSMKARPISPHLQIYRPQLTSVMSITHRLTGLFLSAGALVLLCWLVAAAAGPERYETARAVLGSPVLLALLALWSWAFYYHLCNGVRHLFWDAGMGYELPQAYASGYAVLAVSLLLTVLTWIAVVVGGGS